MAAAIQTPAPPKSAGPTGYLNRLPDFWQTPTNALRDLYAVLLISVVCAATAFAGAAHTRIFGHDIFLLLDGGWRVLNGQRPGVDFSPGTGPLLPLIMAAGLKLAGNSVRGVGYASALFGAMVGFWSYTIARKRMPWTPAILIALLLTLIAVAPYPLGWLPNVLSHAMLYNRYGYALLGIVVLDSFDPKHKTSLGAVSTGILCAALLFLKPSFGLVALAFASCSVLLDLRNRWRPIGILCGLTCTGLAMMAWLRFDLAAVWNSFQLLAGAKSAGISLWQIRWAAIQGLPDFAWLALLAVLATGAFKPTRFAIIVMIGETLLLATNAQAASYPLNAVMAILLVAGYRGAMDQHGVSRSLVLVVSLLCFAPTFVANASGLVYAALDSRRNPPASEVARFRSAPLRDLLLYDVAGGTDADNRSNGRVYVAYVNDGMDLIRKTTKPDETIFTLDMVNPFSYALERRPARGGADCLGFNHQFNDRHKPAPEWLFGLADIVMVPKHPASALGDAQALARNYLPSIQTGFRLCAESEWWQLYKRPTNLASCPAVR